MPRTAYAIQETLYQGFVAPVVLYGVLGAVMWRNRKAQKPDTTTAGAKGGRP